MDLRSIVMNDDGCRGRPTQWFFKVVLDFGRRFPTNNSISMASRWELNKTVILISPLLLDNDQMKINWSQHVHRKSDT